MAGVHRGGGKGHGHAPAGPGGSAAFFASLPPDELTPLEAALRQVLLDWLVNLGHQPFPLTEWVDRRVGGEVETHRDDKGHFTLALRAGVAPPPGHFAPPPGNFGRQPAPGVHHPPGGYYPPAVPPPRAPPVTNALPPPAAERKGLGKGGPEAFFRGLPSDSFSRPEEDLRDSMFDFLASWKSQALANLGDLSRDPNVKKVAERFLPKEVNVGEWIEKRIGAEITLQKEGSGSPIIHLTKPAQAIVADKYKRMEASKAAGHGAPGAPAGRGGDAAPKAAAGASHPRPKADARSVAVDNRSPEEFYKSLPTDEMLNEELALRDAVLAFLDKWPSANPNKPCPSLSDLAQDPACMKGRTALLPQKVSLKDWIDRRIGGEVVVDKDPKGNFEIYLRGSRPPRQQGRSEKGKEKGKEKGNGRSPAESAESFFSALPDDSLTDPEADLRLAVLDYLEQRIGTPVSLQESSKDPAIESAQRAFLAPEVNLRQWINRRIGGEVKIEKDSKGQWVMSRAGEDSTPAQSGNDKKEEFFASLPDDSFSPEEEDLRDTLLAFLGQWRGADPPSLSDVGSDAEIRRARPAILPKGCQVSLKDWIERRIGGEIELAMDPRGSGQWLFGLRGALELPAASRQQGGAKKRRLG